MAYFVQQHTRDIGVRLALGGEPGAIGRMVILQGLRLVTIGILAGTALALFGARYVEVLLFGISAMDLRVVIGVPAEPAAPSPERRVRPRADDAAGAGSRRAGAASRTRLSQEELVPLVTVACDLQGPESQQSRATDGGFQIRPFVKLGDERVIGRQIQSLFTCHEHAPGTN